MRSPSAALTKLTQQRLDSIWRPRLSPKSGEKGFRRFWRKGVSPMVHPRPLNPQGVSRPVCPYAGHRPSHPEIPRRAVGGPCMKIAARGGDGRMAQGLLHEVDGRASVEAMAGMSMAQPVGRDLGGEVGSHQAARPLASSLI